MLLEDWKARPDQIDQAIETIRQALIEGEQSGEPEPFDFATFKQRKAGPR